MIDQKKSILQSSLDRKRYNRIGDDPCTSGVSMWSSEMRPDSEEPNEFGNKSISSTFSSKASRQRFSQNKLIWYAAYDSELKEEIFDQVISEWRNKTKPLQKVPIRLESFDVVFAKVSRLQSMIYLQRKYGGSWFVALYLITLDQLIDIVINKNKKLYPQYTNYEMMNISLFDTNPSFEIDRWLPYGYVMRIANYENHFIYTLTNSFIDQAKEIRNTWNPSSEYIK